VTGAPAPDPQTDPTSSTVRYLAANGIRVLKFEDESIVFNPTSWDAHLLNSAAVAVLDELALGPRTVSDIERLLGEALLDSERAEAAVHARRLLHEFEELGLARRLEESALAGG
jgi:PqqD family protein of HPr-rel-A system